MILPGNKLIIGDISCQDFEQILGDLGEHRVSKLAYHSGILEIRVILPEHEKAKVFISNFV
ncbi:hypothetical protein M595_2795 [Lyngbya aestuarii BL J]|uniref:Uncharacterized protein n=2 Tax=Lyngbya aestuarii TaxID=118322 RepID=U7QH68_9CYAN|nr:hypothetical protein M595_2795 [Lyngbya aestuarii BL J]